MARARASEHRQPLNVDMERFADGFSRALDPVELFFGTADVPDLVVDVVRGADLVAMRIAAYDVELLVGEHPVLRAGPDGGSLVVHLPFQHLTERAIYEVKVDVPDDDEPDDQPETPPLDGFKRPEEARPAKTSRLVFELAAGAEIPFTQEDILAAISQLQMRVHPLARPRPRRVPFPPTGPILGLSTGVVAMVTEAGLVAGPASARRPAPDPTTTAGLIQLMRDRRIARGIHNRLGAVSTGRRGLAGDAVETEITIGGRTVRLPGLVGGGGIVAGEIDISLPPRPRLSREPRTLETAIEAPYRLIISPSAMGGWTHATAPVPAADAEHRIELWHSRLGVRRTAPDESISIDEATARQRIIRAVWTRDREAMADFSQVKKPPHENVPFRMSLDGADRHMLVRQSAETWIGKDGKRLRPEPVDARRLYVSALGAWLDFHGEWETIDYSEAKMSSLESWEHIAPMGRDQFVKVVYPGYLWPFGHRASLVKLTERKMREPVNSIAGLYQRKFLVVRQPVKRFTSADMPFTEITLEPLVTPTLNPEPTGDQQDKAFVPHVNGQPFVFILHCRDHEDRAVRLATPLTWVAEAYTDQQDIENVHSPHRTIAADGQNIAFAPVRKGGDTIAPTASLTFDATAFTGGATPQMDIAAITVDAVEQLSGTGPVKVNYFPTYVTDRFDTGANAGEVWAELVAPVELGFGEGQSSGSDKAGGFVQPNLNVAGLSRLKGTVDDLDNIASGTFDPVEFLKNVSPKLFGLVNLVELLDTIGIDLDDAPTVVSDTLDRIEAFIDDLNRVKRMVEDAVAEADKLRTRAQDKAAELQQQAQAAFDAAVALRTRVQDAATAIVDAIAGLIDADPAQVTGDLSGPLQDMCDAIPDIREVATMLPPLIGRQLETIADILGVVCTAADLIEDIVRFVNGLGSSSTMFSYRYEWTPMLQSWPDDNSPVLELTERSLVLAVEGRMNGKGELGVEALAELKDFALNLLPGADLVRFAFDHLSFRAGSEGKPEVDVVLAEIEFRGMLAFIEVLKELIPFDGFSDPPFLDVTASGLSAGFTQDLPNVAIGVFNLSNLSLGADIQVPFLGEMVTVGFNFCTRERPFTLAVLFIGGGGFFGLRLSPQGLVVLEMSLEAGAVLAVDFGVASGSVSAMLGIYMRLEGDAGSLAGYFRLRGEVDVLGLISASIELYLELNYDFNTGKMVGSASITVKVEVLFFSTSVSIRAERQFAGSNGDPNFVDVMGLEADGTSPAWSEYCLAFAGV